MEIIIKLRETGTGLLSGLEEIALPPTGSNWQTAVIKYCRAEDARMLSLWTRDLLSLEVLSHGIVVAAVKRSPDASKVVVYDRRGVKT